MTNNPASNNKQHQRAPDISAHTNAHDWLVSGQAALKIADWSSAKTCFEEVLRSAPNAESHDGLGIALWWLNDIRAAHDQRILAYNAFKARGDAGRAAVIACWLAREQLFLYGNTTAMQGWFARAARLLDQSVSNSERAWCQMFSASIKASPHELAATSAQIIEVSRSFGDSNLEALSMAFYGQARVTLGQIDAGMADLDEAMTMTTGGEVSDFMVISEVFCVLLAACETAADLVRCEHWCQIAAAFAERHHCSFLSAYCRTTYGSLMTATGRWEEAETALVEALHTFELGHRGLRVHAVIKLADLRVYQGRLEEAAALLVGLEDHGLALVPLARLHLARGEIALAKAILDQTLKSAHDATLDHLPARLLLVEVLLAANELEAARQAVADLMILAQQTQSDLLLARAELAQGQLMLSAGEMTAAMESFNAALNRLSTYEQSLVAGRVRLEMARTLQHDDPYGAVTWAKAALATFERIGAVRAAAEAAGLLRELGVHSGQTARSRQPLTRRESEILALVALGLTNREIAERLVISPKTAEHHVSRILSKLNLRTRAEAVAFAVSGKHLEQK